MSIATEIEDLQTNLEAAKDAVEAKGGTVGDTGLAGLADEIATIPSGGSFSCKTDYGRLWYAPFETTVETRYTEGCVVTINSGKFMQYLNTNPIRDMGRPEKQANFDYDSGGQTWQSWDFETPVAGLTSEQLAEQLGIMATVNAGAEWAMFEIQVVQSQIVGADWVNEDLTSAGWQSMQGQSEYDTTYNIDVAEIPAAFARRFEFGTIPTTVGSVLNRQGSGLAELGQFPGNLTGSFSLSLGLLGSFNSPLIFPSGIYDVVLDGNSGSSATFNSPVMFLPDSTTSSASTRRFIIRNLSAFNSPFYVNENTKYLELSNLSSFNQKIDLPSSLTDLTISGLSSFNQKIFIPSSLTSLTLSALSSFNQDFSLPQGMAYHSIQRYFMNNCDNFVGTIDVGNLRPDTVFMSSYPDFDNFYTTNPNAPCYVNGIKIAGQNRAAWLAAFEDLSSSSQRKYRHLVDAGY